MSSGTTVPAESSEQDAEVEKSVSAPPMQEGIERELSHEEYDPKGTLALILIYLGILVLMWVFMYFVEFLGNEFVVVG
ncbi:hypothetical protein [Salinibaculum rarum]|jgi:hypothetical protein|uniref:hypothetical protein n=1 Tax=Salinibaculum rarum TaxID=3058903 RepID=UPI00265FB71D|nr:hypothetical protein [Salinibaculum sp. KK48]